MKFTRAILAAALGAAVIAPVPAMAVPAVQGAKLASPANHVEQVRYGYGNRHGGYGYGGGYGRAAMVIGAALAVVRLLVASWPAR